EQPAKEKPVYDETNDAVYHVVHGPFVKPQEYRGLVGVLNPTGVDFDYDIVAPEGSKVALRLLRLELESCCDYINISNGDGTTRSVFYYGHVVAAHFKLGSQNPNGDSRPSRGHELVFEICFRSVFYYGHVVAAHFKLGSQNPDGDSRPSRGHELVFEICFRNPSLTVSMLELLTTRSYPQSLVGTELGYVFGNPGLDMNPWSEELKMTSEVNFHKPRLKISPTLPEDIENFLEVQLKIERNSLMVNPKIIRKWKKADSHRQVGIMDGNIITADFKVCSEKPQGNSGTVRYHKLVVEKDIDGILQRMKWRHNDTKLFPWHMLHRLLDHVIGVLGIRPHFTCRHVDPNDLFFQVSVFWFLLWCINLTCNKGRLDVLELL
ncbi:unnamed protein product, partial [Notodromas monacha]